jgi:hypothetical protein
MERKLDGLAATAVVFLGANLLHGLDHMRQHLAGVTAVVGVGGAVLTATAVVVVVLTLRRHPQAPLIATVVGVVAALLVAGSHLAPHWSVISDSYVDDIHPDPLAWVIMIVEIGSALAMALVGFRRLRASNAQGRSVTSHAR